MQSILVVFCMASSTLWCKLSIVGGYASAIPSAAVLPCCSLLAYAHDATVLLQGRFDPDNFSQEVADVAQKLVPLTVTLWNKVSAKMLPTPAKFHYLFNMRELSKVNTVYRCCRLKHLLYEPWAL